MKQLVKASAVGAAMTAVICLLSGCNDAEVYYFFKGTPLQYAASIAEPHSLRYSQPKYIRRNDIAALPLITSSEDLRPVPNLENAVAENTPVEIRSVGTVEKAVVNTPVEKVEIAPAPKPIVEKRISKVRIAHAKRRLFKKAVIAIPAIVEEKLWNTESDDETAGLNVTSPMEEIVANAFEEESESDFAVSSAPSRVAAAGEVPPPIEGDEKLVTEFIGEMVPNDYSDLESSLAELHSIADHLEPIEVPESPPSSSDDKVAKPDDDDPVKDPPPVESAETGPPEVTTQHFEPELVSPPVRIAAVEPQLTAPMVTQPAEPILEAPKVPTLMRSSAASQETATNVLSPKPAVQVPVSTQQEGRGRKATQNLTVVPSKTLPPKPIVQAVGNEDEVIEENIEVVVEPDTRVRKSLNEAPKKFIDVFLRPVNRLQDVSATIRPDAELSESPRFFFPKAELRGSYRLFAVLYKENDLYAPETPIEHPAVINAQSARGVIHFPISQEAVNGSKTKSTDLRREGKATISLLVSEVVASDSHLPKIANPKVRILNGDVADLVIDPSKEGEVLLANVTPGELLVEVSAEGFYPSYQVIPATPNRLTYWRVQLIRRKWVTNALGSYDEMMKGLPVIGLALEPNTGIVAGRVCDPKNKQPLAGERVRISSRREDFDPQNWNERPVYFNHSLPFPLLPATAPSGYFIILNTEDGLRKVSRDQGFTHMLDVRPGAGEYFEMGCAGAADLKFALTDSDSGERVDDAHVHMVRDLHADSEANAEGIYELPKVDLPHGMYEVEVQEKGSPTAWYPVTIDPLEVQRTHQFYTLDEKVLQDNAIKVARQPKLETSAGNLIGMIPSYLFTDQTECVRVELRDHYGRVVNDKNAYLFSSNEQIDPRSAVPGCFHQKRRVYAYYNLEISEFVVNYIAVPKDKTKKEKIEETHVRRIGPNRTTISIQ